MVDDDWSMSEPLHPEVVILNTALELPDGERAAYLDIACADDDAIRQQVAALLEAHERADDFLNAAPVGPADIPDARKISPEQSGDRVGRYKVLQQIGEGGCGVVYLAEQEEPVRRPVALKVIKLGMDTRSVIARFEAERQALAMMDHPNIAKVFDAGTTETGRPYFVMELVRGTRITELCDAKNLSTEERLMLFIQVCQAIQHAHQKGVIHRDIKPSNILVTLNDGVAVPKVIDFGIAKATQGRLTDQTMFTALEQFLGTPAYMSPEQAAVSSADIDTRSDIYSLGVLLYELLTGRTPFDQKELLAAGLDEMRRIIREVEPAKPSARLTSLRERKGARKIERDEASGGYELPSKALAAELKRPPPKSEIGNRKSRIEPDLDWIVMKCLEKDRARRYETANGLAADIQRHLNHEPVSARPPGNWYRFHKLVRRNKLAFAAISALAVALLIVAIGSSVAAWRVAGARRAEHGEREKAEAANLQLRGTVRLLELERAEDFFRDQDAAQGVAHLAAMLRRDPSNHIAANRLVSALLYRDWALPAAAPMRHLGPVESVSFSPDGQRLLSASRDGTANVWDATTGRSLATVRHGERVLQASYSPDGTRFVTASADGTARIWSATNGAALTASLTHAGRVNWAEFSGDGRRVVTASADKTAKIWDVRTGGLQQVLLGHSREIVVARFSPDGRVVATGNENGGLRTWSVESGKTLVQMNLPARIHALTFSPDGRRLLVAYDNGTARLWDCESGEIFGEPLVHSTERMPVWHAAFSPDGRFILTTAEDGAGRLWNAERGHPIGPRLPHAAGVVFGSFSPDGTMVVTTSSDNSARLWEVRTGKPIGQPMRGYERILHAAFSPDGARLVTASFAWMVEVWDIRPRRAAGFELASDDDVRSVAFSPDSGTLLVGSWDQTARLWDVRSGQLRCEPVAHSGPVYHATFSPDGRRFVTVSTSRRTQVRDAAKGTVVAEPFEHTNRLCAASFSPDGERLVTASADGTARVWNVRTAEPVTPTLPHRGTVNIARFSPDGRFIATASEDWSARIWDAKTGQPVTEPLLHLDHVRWVDFSPDSRRIVTASTDNTACIWEVSTGRRVTPPLQHARLVEPAVFSPDGRRIATASLDRTARIWDAGTGQAVTPPLQHDYPVTQVCFSPDGSRVLTACRNAVRMWDVETGRPLTESLPIYGWVWSACFDPSGQRIAAGAKRAHLWEVPSAPVPVPEWFAEFAGSVAGIRLDGRVNTTLVPWQNFGPPTGPPRDAINDFYQRLAAWFLAEPGKRSASPF